VYLQALGLNHSQNVLWDVTVEELTLDILILEIEYHSFVLQEVIYQQFVWTMSQQNFNIDSYSNRYRRFESFILRPSLENIFFFELEDLEESNFIVLRKLISNSKRNKKNNFS